MKAKIFLYAAMTLLATATFTGCDDDDGDWDEMVWSVDVKTIKDGFIKVPNSGGTYSFACKNYSGFWLSGITETTGTQKSLYSSDDESNTAHSITSSWATVSVEGNTLTVKIEPNESEQSRCLDVEVTAGDIFDNFVFIQQ